MCQLRCYYYLYKDILLLSTLFYELFVHRLIVAVVVIETASTKELSWECQRIKAMPEWHFSIFSCFSFLVLLSYSYLCFLSLFMLFTVSNFVYLLLSDDASGCLIKRNNPRIVLLTTPSTTSTAFLQRKEFVSN